MSRTTAIVLGVLAVLAVAAGTTVLNRKWWVRRINGRWSIMLRGEVPDLPGNWLAEAEKVEYREADAARHSIAELYDLYTNGGGEGWTRKTT